MKILKNTFKVFLTFYCVCLVLGVLRINSYFGALGIAPFALLGHKSSIAYLYDCFSFDHYDSTLSKFWLRRGAQSGIPEFQRLYGEDLLRGEPAKGIALLTQAAAGNDYYANAILARLYADPDSKFRNPSLADYYEKKASTLVPAE